jgi:hypothetical protein
MTGSCFRCLTFTFFSFFLLSFFPASRLDPYPVHPFYVSVTEVAHNAKDKALEISCKIFADDMEVVLKQKYNAVIDIDNEKQQAQINKLINDYITKHLALSVDGKPVSLSYVGFEKQSESVYCYFEVPDISSLKKLDLSNSLLQDFNNQQINIMHITVNGNRKSYKLEYPKKEASFSF